MTEPIDYTRTDMISILVCTIPERNEMFRALMLKLEKQASYCKKVHPTLGKIQILVNNGKRFTEGGLSIGDKRQSLLDLAIGKYVCYLDDDEDISPDYLETILRLCYEDKDVCTFRSLSKLSNNWALVDLKLGNITEQINPDTITLRPPWHICPVRREFAQCYKFTDSNYGEDWVWFEQILWHCKSDAHTDKIIHSYRHGDHSEADKI